MSANRKKHEPPNLDVVLKQATAVIGDKEKALRWLGTPVRDLNYKTPVAMLSEAGGTQAVLSVLSRLEYGVF